MKRFAAAIIALTVAITPALAEAGNHKSKHNNKGAKSSHCPPGLAKKNPPCVPPGQAKKYGRGDYIYRDYDVIRDPERYGLRKGDNYYRVGDYVYRVDKDTREVLDLIGAVDAILN